jgi:mycothiol synthase
MTPPSVEPHVPAHVVVPEGVAADGAAGIDVEVRSRLDPALVRAVLTLVSQAADADGVTPLSEHVLLHLRHGGEERAVSLVALRGKELVGYAHLDVTDPVEGSSAELAVAPQARGLGVGRRLVQTLLESSPGGRLRLWAHGEHPAAAALALSLGFERTRVLWQMRRSLYAPIPEPLLPAGVTVRTFVVGQDEQPWTEVNARAFVGHPEQGAWSPAELELRESEPWFDPNGFFLAERAGRLVGFHWTKVHGGTGTPGDGHHHDPIGEVYVVGVDPSEQGTGLGSALTIVGLRHLRAQGLAEAMLYVDESNAAAIRVYERLGFARWDSDVRYSRG